MKNKKALIWIFAVLLTISAAIYQRLTGPTHPQRTSATIAGQIYKFSLRRTFDGPADCPITISIADQQVSGTLEYRVFPQKVDYTKLNMVREGANLTASLPHQGMAGKLEYRIILNKGSEQVPINIGVPTVIRF